MGDEDWTAVEGVEPIADERLIDSLDVLAELTHEIRGRLLRRMARPATVADLAAMLDVPVTRLYHHINRLEEQGLIGVVATRQAGGVVERRYRAVAEVFKIDPRLMERADDAGLSRALGALFDMAKVELQAEVEGGLLRGAAVDEQVTMSLAELSLSPDRVVELRQKLLDLVEEYRQDDPADPDDPGNERFRLFVVGYPATR